MTNETNTINLTIPADVLERAVTAAISEMLRRGDLSLAVSRGIARSSDAVAKLVTDKIHAVISEPEFAGQMQSAIKAGLLKSTMLLERVLIDATSKAAEGAVGRFLASTFARLRTALDAAPAVV